MWNAGIRSGELIPLITACVARDFTKDMCDIHRADAGGLDPFPGRGWEMNALRNLLCTIFSGAPGPRGAYVGCNATRVHQWLVQGGGWDAMLRAVEGTLNRALHPDYSASDAQYVQPHIRDQLLTQLRVLTGGVLPNKDLGPILADKCVESSAGRLRGMLDILREPVSAHLDPGGSIQGYVRQLVAIMMVQLERVETQQRVESSRPPPPVHSHYLGHIVGDRAKAFFDAMGIRAFCQVQNAPELVMFESLGVRPSRAMCERGGPLDMGEFRQVTNAVKEEHLAIAGFLEGPQHLQDDAAWLAARGRWLANDPQSAGAGRGDPGPRLTPKKKKGKKKKKKKKKKN